ncbi:MAG: hypothetical protein HDT15_05055 [Oscillibacter sp.]|nr:hypothetical protein [Oscillibacter sp.]
MWEKLKNLSGGAKAGIIAGAVLVAAAGIGLGVTQPWNQQEDIVPDEPDTVQQEPVAPEKQPEKGVSLQVDGKKVPCVVYEGDGWSIYVPEEWSTEKVGENGGRFSSGDGAQLEVRFEPGSDYMGKFVNLSATGDGRMLQFYNGIGEGSQVVEGSAQNAKWGQYDKLLVAMAKSLTVGDEKPFAESYIIPDDPDWQKADGMTVLFLDKDGYVVDREMQTVIENFMKGWPVEDREVYTGQYRINSLEWASRYAGLTKDGFVDVFRADVQYRVNEGAEPEGVTLVDGWANVGGSVYLAILHDGGSVSKTIGSTGELEGGWAEFAARIA